MKILYPSRPACLRPISPAHGKAFARAYVNARRKGGGRGYCASTFFEKCRGQGLGTRDQGPGNSKRQRRNQEPGTRNPETATATTEPACGEHGRAGARDRQEVCGKANGHLGNIGKMGKDAGKESRLSDVQIPKALRSKGLRIWAALRNFANLCESLRIVANRCESLRIFADLCESLQIFANLCVWDQATGEGPKRECGELLRMRANETEETTKPFWEKTYGFPPRSQWFPMVANGCEWYRMVLNGTQWYSMVLNGCEWYSLVPVGP